MALIVLFAALGEFSCNFLEGCFKAITYGANRTNNHDSDERSDQTVFDRGCS